MASDELVFLLFTEDTATIDERVEDPKDFRIVFRKADGPLLCFPPVSVNRRFEEIRVFLKEILVSCEDFGIWTDVNDNSDAIGAKP